MDSIRLPQFFKITPLRFAHGATPHYTLKYAFRNVSEFKDQIIRIGVDLTTRNNSWCQQGNYHDGYEKDIFATFGETLTVMIEPQKYVYNQNRAICRSEPYNELLYKKISEVISRNCSNPCRLSNYWHCEPMMKHIGHLPICQDKTETKCFTQVKDKAANGIELKPCTKLQYKYDLTFWPNFCGENEIKFLLKFLTPVGVKVKEEYFIIELASVIGAIGGTLGLCIGFNFRQLFGHLLTAAEIGMNLVKLRIKLGQGIYARGK